MAIQSFSEFRPAPETHIRWHCFQQLFCHKKFQSGHLTDR
jgi:hypothetical protein